MNNASSGDYYESTSQPQNKKRKMYCDCIIHCPDSIDKLLSPGSLESWNVILRAAEIRNHKLTVLPSQV